MFNCNTRFLVGGVSSSSGFELNIIKKFDPLIINFKTRGYEGIETLVFFSSLDILFKSIITIAYIYGWIIFFDNFSFPVWLNIVTVILAFMIWISVTTAYYYIQEVLSIFLFWPALKEWHALEHKCALIIEAESIPTVENIKKIPMAHIRCGTSVAFVQLQLSMSFYFLMIVLIIFLSDNIESISIPFVILSAYWAVASSVILEWIVVAENNWSIMKKIIFWLSSPVATIAIVLDRLLVLKTPSDDKIKEVSEDLTSFIKERGLYS